jgi:hypothetical protein
MAVKTKLEAQNPLILRCHRLMEAFTKSDDERDFYLDRQEGFIVYVDLDKPQTELDALEAELNGNKERYCLIPKLTFYETKKIMEGFVNEKVYDIDTKEKLLDIIQSKEARENFLEFLYDHHSELEKWQQYYQERSRIRIIEWLRNSNFHFVFEEDLDLSKIILERVKKELFETKPSKEVVNARKALFAKAKTYYSNEALNPRPKRGRPPKQAVKQEVETQVSTDIYTTVPNNVRPFLFTPDITSASAVTFSSKFETEEQLLANRRHQHEAAAELELLTIQQKLATLRTISSRWVNEHERKEQEPDLEGDLDEEEEELEEEVLISKKAKPSTPAAKRKSQPEEKTTSKKEMKEPPKAKEAAGKNKKIKIIPKTNAKPTTRPKPKLETKKPKKVEIAKKKLQPLKKTKKS